MVVFTKALSVCQYYGKIIISTQNIFKMMQPTDMNQIFLMFTDFNDPLI